MNTDHSFTEQETFDAVIVARMIMIYSALKVTEPTFEQSLALAIALGTDAMTELRDATCPFHQVCWTMYELVTDEEDPVKRVHMAPWMVHGVVEFLHNNDFDFSSIDPSDWTRNTEEVLAGLPKEFGNPLVRALLDVVKHASDNAPPEDVALLKEAIAAKQAAILARHNQTVH